MHKVLIRCRATGIFLSDADPFCVVITNHKDRAFRFDSGAGIDMLLKFLRAEYSSFDFCCVPE